MPPFAEEKTGIRLAISGMASTTLKTWREKLPDSGEKPLGKPSSRSVWVKSVKKPQDGQPVVPTTTEESPAKRNSVKEPPSIRTVWVVSERSPESVKNLEPIKDSEDEHLVTCSSPSAEAVMVSSVRRSPESRDPDRNQQFIIGRSQDKKFSINSIPVEFDKKLGLPQPVLKSQGKKKSVVTSSPLVRSVWVVSARGSPHSLKNSESIKDSQNEHFGACSSPFAEGILVGPGRKSPEPHQNQKLILESQDNNSSIRSVRVVFDKEPDLPPQPIAKSSQSKKSVVRSSPLVRSVWVESVKKSPELPESLLVEFSKESSESPFISSVLVESVEESSKKPRTKWKKDTLPVYETPEHLKHQIEMDRVPKVLREPLSLSNYVDYFSVLLHADDFYIEKWNGFLMYSVNLELDEKRTEEERKKRIAAGSVQKEQTIYVLFEIASVPERRPYLLSRDFVYVRRSGRQSKPIEGRLVRVIKSTHVLTEFGMDFQAQYSPIHKYDVSFSFNRTCLKRSHQAVEAALVHSFRAVLFPNCPPRSTVIFPTPVTLSNQDFDQSQTSAIQKIMSHRGPPPYLIKGPLSLTKDKNISRVGALVLEAVVQIYRNSPSCRILVSAPKNRTCDTLITSLNKEIPDSDLFRANAAFREIGDVDEDVLPLSSYDGECFSEPLLSNLQAFKVITSTFMTSFRLHCRGIAPGHFTHIFMVDASSATEPETMVALANLVGDETVVVVTGSARDHPNRVRSDIGRRYGLKRSYFHRLLESEPYSTNNPECVSIVGK